MTGTSHSHSHEFETNAAQERVEPTPQHTMNAHIFSRTDDQNKVQFAQTVGGLNPAEVPIQELFKAGTQTTASVETIKLTNRDQELI